MRNLQRLATLTVFITDLSVGVAAQTPAKPSFEVASVKPNKSGDPGMSIQTQPGGRFIASNTPLRTLMLNAYDLQTYQLIGLPDWAASERFDITAKAEHEIVPTTQKPNPVQLMMQFLLEDRFQLKAHTETRDLPAYALTVTRPDGKLGPQLKPSVVDCLALMKARAAGGPSPPRPAPGERPPCGMRVGRGVYTAGGTTMADLAMTLSSPAQRLVIDRTGLTGGFDFDLSFTNEQSADTTGPSLFTAVQEQLGLKLEATRVPMTVLVIDSVERPAPD